MTALYRVWCLSWNEDEEQGADVVSYDILGECPPDRRHVIQVPDTVLHDAADAAEAYGDYVYRMRDAYEDTWPLTFRVRGPDDQVGDYTVDCQHVPEFSASPVKVQGQERRA